MSLGVERRRIYAHYIVLVNQKSQQDVVVSCKYRLAKAIFSQGINPRILDCENGINIETPEKIGAVEADSTGSVTLDLRYRIGV